MKHKDKNKFQKALEIFQKFGIEDVTPPPPLEPGQRAEGQELSELGQLALLDVKEIYLTSLNGEDRPMLYLGDTPVVRNGHMSLLSAKAGYGKSNVVESIAAAYLADYHELQDDRIDCLGYRADCQKNKDGSKKPVLFIDTERGEGDSKRGIQRIIKRIYPDYRDPNILLLEGHEYFEEKFPGLRYLNLMEVDALDRRLSLVYDLIESGMYGLVILDGIGDICGDTNSNTESSELVHSLVSKAQRHQFGLVVTLHQNPRDDKMRGHLGTACWQKAESCFGIVRDKFEELRTITSDIGKFGFGKVRSYGDRNDVFFKWDTDCGFFVQTAADDFQAEIPIDYEQVVELIVMLLESKDNRRMKRAEMTDFLMVKYKLSLSKIKRSIKYGIEAGTLLSEQMKGQGSPHMILLQGTDPKMGEIEGEPRWSKPDTQGVTSDDGLPVVESHPGAIIKPLRTSELIFGSPKNDEEE